MKKILLLIFLLACNNVFSQRIKGVVLDFSTKTPVQKAHILFKDKVLLTNNKGEFSFRLHKKESINLTITHIKYKTKSIDYDVIKSPVVIYLDEKVETLEEVKLNTNKKLKNSIEYKKLQNLPKGVYSFGSILKNNKIHVFGGDNSSLLEKNKKGITELQRSTEEEIMKILNRPSSINFNNFEGSLQTFDFETRKWTHIKDKVLKRAYFKAVLKEENIYLLGGKKLSKTKSRDLLENNIEIISTKDFSVIKDQTNPHQAVDFGATVYDNKIVVFGGSTKLFDNGRKNYSDEVHLYNSETGYWYLLTKMSKGKEVNGIIFKNNLYLFGGFRGKKLKEIESFNLKTGKWKKEGELFRAMKNPAITTDNELIYLYEAGRFVVFNPLDKTLKEYRTDINLAGADMHFLNDNLYVLGGYQIEDFRKSPSNGFYRIKISEFLKTKSTNTKVLF